MKVFRRIVIKLIIFVLVVAVFGGAAYVKHYYPQSSPESALNQYLTLLSENNTEKSYDLLDQSENTEMTLEEYETAIQTGKYALYDSWQIEETGTRQGTAGESYVDYHVEFLDVSETLQMECDFSVKKQSDVLLGLLNQWKVQGSHCLITDLRITVPGNAAVYLDSEEIDTSWKVTDDVAASKDCYEIPSLLPEKITVVIRHPILESISATLDPSDGDVDYSDQMTLKESARSACEELAVKALKQIYTAAAKENTDNLESVFGDCLEEAAEIAESQMEEFYQENAEFKSVGIYDFEADFEDPVYTDDINGAITTEMTFTYHYIVREDVIVESDEMQEDDAEGTTEEETQTQTVSASGEATASFTMAYYDEEWHIASVSLPVIPE
ncbi:MAG: hypothetical protein LUH07_12210 [Lachnospiraceae bacterium]|nr:hypothetical protein [Lachnospiraceae bacterium]